MNNQLPIDLKSMIKNRSTTLSEIDKPLKFFALALLIVEVLIGILSVNASAVLMSQLLLAGTSMFVLVVMMVVLLLFTRPEWLVITNSTDALAILREKKLETKNKLKEQSSILLASFNSLNKHIESDKNPEEFKFPFEEFEKIKSNVDQIIAMETVEKELNPKFEVDYTVELKNAQLNYLERKFDESWEIVSNVLTKHPKNTDAKLLARSIWFGKGRQSHRDGKYEEAISNYNKSLEYDKNYVTAVYNIACNLNLLEKTSESMEYLKRCINKNPRYKKMAKEDMDFKSLIDKKDPTFLSLVN